MLIDHSCDKDFSTWFRDKNVPLTFFLVNSLVNKSYWDRNDCGTALIATDRSYSVWQILSSRVILRLKKTPCFYSNFHESYVVQDFDCEIYRSDARRNVNAKFINRLIYDLRSRMLVIFTFGSIIVLRAMLVVVG